jgi:predicted metal-dependent TIM-barrel fold hydrolase
MIMENGFWTGFTLYPVTKTSPGRAVDMFERYGTERICVASACDWGPSDPTAIPRFALEMRRRGHDDELIREIVFENPKRFLGQSPKFHLKRGEKARVAV